MSERDLFKAWERNHERLHKYPNVTAVGTGTKVVGGKDTGELCIKVYVSQKLPFTALKVEDLIPATVDAFKTDVEVMGPFKAESTPEEHQKRIRPILGGISTSRVAPGTGTILGAYFRDKTDGKDVDASNNHVWAMVFDPQPPNPPGVSLIQPGVADGGTGDPAFVIDGLKRCVPLKAAALTGGAPPKDRWNRVDLAVGSLKVEFERTILGPKGARIYAIDYRRLVPDDVKKKTKGISSSRTLAISYGHPSAVNISTWVDYGSGRYCFFTDCAIITKDPPSTEFCKAGCSGSPYLVDFETKAHAWGEPADIEGVWAGIVFAGDQYGNGVICQPDNILSEGQLEFAPTGPAPPPPPTRKYGPSSLERGFKVLSGELLPSTIVGDLDKDSYHEAETVTFTGFLLDAETRVGLPQRRIDYQDVKKAGLLRRRGTLGEGSIQTNDDGSFLVRIQAQDAGDHVLKVMFAGDQA